MNKEIIYSILKVVNKILSYFLFLIIGICLYLFFSLKKNYMDYERVEYVNR